MTSTGKRAALIVGFTIACAIGAFVVPPIAQPARYHDFADHRALFGIANFGDVASNFAFLLAGLAGLGIVFTRREAFELSIERWPYAAFFAGLVLTAAGSAYYHAAPDNARLFWDRLPMTVAFAGLVSAQIVDRISARAGIALLLPMLAVAAASVFYWRATELAGQGNLVPYGVVQGYTIVVLLVVASLWPSRYSHGRDLLLVFGFYALAKVCEALDRHIFEAGYIVSGHTLKHLFAALSGFAACAMLARRRRLSAGDGVVLQSRAAVT